MATKKINTTDINSKNDKAWEKRTLEEARQREERNRRFTELQNACLLNYGEAARCALAVHLLFDIRMDERSLENALEALATPFLSARDIRNAAEIATKKSAHVELVRGVVGNLLFDDPEENVIHHLVSVGVERIAALARGSNFPSDEFEARAWGEIIRDLMREDDPFRHQQRIIDNRINCDTRF